MSGARTIPGHGAEANISDAPAAVAAVRTFHTLDALRGLAALTVVLYHTAFFYGVKAPAEGQIAVDLFFVMSGFIIAYRYDRDFRNGMGVRTFALVRLIRLYPLYLLGGILGVIPAILAVMAGDTDVFHRGMIASFPLHAAMLPSRFAMPKLEELYPLNYVAWSLTLEVLVNIAYAATFRFWTLGRLVVLCAVSLAGLAVCAIVYGSLIGGFSWAHAPVGFCRVLYGFPAGVILCRLYQARPFAIRVPWWTLLVVSAAIFFVPVPNRAMWEFVVIGAFVPAIVVAAIASEPPGWARGACAIAGVFSYVVYSLHAPFIGYFLRGEERMHLDLHVQSTSEAAIFTLLLTLLCIGAHFLYDRPVRRQLSRVVFRRSVAPANALRPAVKY